MAWWPTETDTRLLGKGILHLLNILLLILLLAPPIILLRHAERLRWASRHALAALPATVTGAGYGLASMAFVWLECEGDVKGLYGCMAYGRDISGLIEYGLFLLIPFLFVAAPLSAWLLLDTGARQIGAWNRAG